MALQQVTQVEPEPGTEAHELASVLAARGFRLNATLLEMLAEHYSHRTERRGSGYTQAGRHLAVLVNRPRDPSDDSASLLFPDSARRRAELVQVLRELPSMLAREESRLLAALIGDLVSPLAQASVAPELPAFFGELKVGTCPLAEKYFLEIRDGFVRRKGRVNVLVSERGDPLLLEKLNLGDNHSCISVAEVMLNGVRLPPGCLFGVAREDQLELRANRQLPGSIIAAGRCTGFRFLRLTTLAVSPQFRRRAFTTHFQAQLDAGLFEPGEATVEQLRRVAQEQL